MSVHHDFAERVLSIGGPAGGMAALSFQAGLSKKQTSTRYSTRLLRYAIPLVWLEELRGKMPRPLRILEIGTGSGQMKRFVDAARAAERGSLYDAWTGLDIAPQEARLAQAGYGKVEVFDADQFTTDATPSRVFAGFDVVLLLHVLEHLKDPEGFLKRLTPALDLGVCLIGGVPSTPHALFAARQARLRQKYLPGGHWCKFSSTRVAQMLKESGWSKAEITGAFLLRSSGSPLENSATWMRWNLALAHRWSWWPGEVYFRAVKEAAPGS